MWWTSPYDSKEDKVLTVFVQQLTRTAVIVTALISVVNTVWAVDHEKLTHGTEHSFVQFTTPDLSLELPAAVDEDEPSPRQSELDSGSAADVDRIDSSLIQDDPDWLSDDSLLDSGETLPRPTELTNLAPHDQLLASDANAAPVYSTGTWFRRGLWYTEIEFIMMHQSQLTDESLAYDATANDDLRFQPLRLFRTDDASPRFEPGARITLGRFLGRDAANRDHTIDFTFLGFFEWSAAAEYDSVAPRELDTLIAGDFVAPDGSRQPPLLPGFSRADRQAFQYNSDLASFEVNFRVRGRPGRDVLAMLPNGKWVRYGASSAVCSFLGGVRIMSVNDSFFYTSVQDADPDNDIPLRTGEYLVKSHNDMLGLQGGFERVEKYSEWYWGVKTKVGGLVNLADRESRITSINGIDPRAQRVDDENLVLLLEGGFFVAYNIRPNLALRANYDTMYITGLANSDKNVSLENDTFPVLNLSGHHLYFGLGVGLEWVW